MSSFKKAAKQKIYRERGQPSRRKHLGLLEKRYDRRVRDRLAEKKRQYLKEMHEKAMTRNPDEFDMGMINARTENGWHVSLKDRKVKEIPTKELLEISNHDIGYLKMHEEIDKKKQEKMQSSLHFLEDKPRPKQHLIFVDTKEDAQQFDPAEHFDTLPEFLDRTYNRPTKAQLRDPELIVVAVPEGTRQPARAPKKSDLRAVEEERALAYDELKARQSRAKRLKTFVDELEVKKKVDGSSKKNKPSAIELKNGRKVYQWKRQRAK